MSMLARARQRLSEQMTRGAVADFVALVRDAGSVLADVAGILFPAAGGAPAVGAPAVGAPAPTAASPRIATGIDLGNIRFERRVPGGGRSRLVRRLAANGVRCHAARKPTIPRAMAAARTFRA